jgi:hypothetical protein
VAYRAVLTDPGDGRDDLVRVWTDNLPVRGDVRAKLAWSYLDAPAGKGEALLLRDDAGAAVGCAGITVRELWHRDRPLRAALLADFAIDRAHRTGMPALVLQRATKRHAEGAYDLAYGFPNQNAVAIHRRIGFHELGGMPRYVRVLRHGAYLERKYGNPIATRAAGAVIDAAKLAVRAARALAPSRSAELAWPRDVDARFDRLWEETRGAWGIACRRDAAFLRWRFLRKPDERARIAALASRRGGALRAYAIVGGTPGDAAHLHDLYGSIEAQDDLLTLLVPALTRDGHTAVSVRFLGDRRIGELLLAHNFSLRDSLRMVIVSEGARCPIDAATLRDRSAWYLTDLDEDT